MPAAETTCSTWMCKVAAWGHGAAAWMHRVAVWMHRVAAWVQPRGGAPRCSVAPSSGEVLHLDVRGVERGGQVLPQCPLEVGPRHEVALTPLGREDLQLGGVEP